MAKIVLTVTKRTDKVIFRPMMDWGKKSILVSGGRQYILEECIKRENHGKFQDLQAASKIRQDLQHFREADRLEFESRVLAKETLDLEFESSRLVMKNCMVMQEREVLENVIVHTEELKDETHHYKSVEATVAGLLITK